MEITKSHTADALDVVVDGRLDGYWADHLDTALGDAVREGHHRIRLDCAKVSFISSAGIGVLAKFYKELAAINGLFVVVNPSKPVITVLRITRLADMLVEPAAPDAATAAREKPARQFEREKAEFDVFDLGARAPLTCRAIGDPRPLASGAFGEEQSVSLEALSPTLAIGVGAFGDNFADCKPRFGELLSVVGATAYQPADGTNVPDYLLNTGSLGADVRMLYGLMCEGPFSHLVRFEALHADAPLGLAQLVACCLDQVETQSLGFVILAEASGLVGASLRRSPAETRKDPDFFQHPGVQGRLTFTAERAFTRSVALAAGIATRTAPAAALAQDAQAMQLRPLGAGCFGHVHAAAFPFRPLKKGLVAVGETVTSLFEPEALLGVLHLLNDDRGAAGAGESEFIRGACWIGPLTGSWQ
jgi:anti-anti-sigma factor